MELLVMMIGNTVDCGKVTGAVFNSRSQCDKMSLWLTTSKRDDEDYIRYIGDAFKRVVQGQFQMSCSIRFETHMATQTKTGKDAKSLYEIRIPGSGGSHFHIYNSSRASFRAESKY